MFVYSQHFELTPAAEFGGIGSFFKKLGKAALPLASTVAGFIPGVGTAAKIAIDAGTSIAGGLLERGGGAGGPAKGLAGITAFGKSVTDELEKILKKPGDPDAVSNAQSLAALLSDSSRVYQPKKGKDKAALDAAKARAAELVAQIERAAAQAAAANEAAEQQATAAVQAAGGQLVKLPNGQFVTVQGPAATIGGGVDPTQLLLVAAGLGALILFTRK